MLYVMGTGSRSLVTRRDRREIYTAVQDHILFLAEYHELHLISGMAEGFDEMIAKIAFRNSIPYSVYIPSPSYGEYYWAQHSLLGRNRLNIFEDLRKGAAAEYVVCANHDYGRANFVRNQAMVNACDRALVFDATSRGTKDAVQRLQAASKPFEVYPFPKQSAPTLF